MRVTYYKKHTDTQPCWTQCTEQNTPVLEWNHRGLVYSALLHSTANNRQLVVFYKHYFCMCWCLMPCVCAHRFKPRCFAVPCIALHTNNPLGSVRICSGGETIQWINGFQAGASVQWDSQTQRGSAGEQSQGCVTHLGLQLQPEWTGDDWLNCRWIHLEKQERWAPGQPWGARELWEFKEQHIPKNQLFVSFSYRKRNPTLIFFLISLRKMLILGIISLFLLTWLVNQNSVILQSVNWTIQD